MFTPPGHNQLINRRPTDTTAAESLKPRERPHLIVTAPGDIQTAAGASVKIWLVGVDMFSATIIYRVKYYILIVQFWKKKIYLILFVCCVFYSILNKPLLYHPGFIPATFPLMQMFSPTSHYMHRFIHLSVRLSKDNSGSLSCVILEVCQVMWDM